MGAWATGVFDNDDAGDWVWELEDAIGLTVLHTAFASMSSQSDYLEAPDCSIALAAAEVVAALSGHPAQALPNLVSSFVERNNSPPSSNLIATALNAVERIRSGSELRELWDASGHSSEWLNAVADLEARLAKSK